MEDIEDIFNLLTGPSANTGPGFACPEMDDYITKLELVYKNLVDFIKSQDPEYDEFDFPHIDGHELEWMAQNCKSRMSALDFLEIARPLIHSSLNLDSYWPSRYGWSDAVKEVARYSHLSEDSMLQKTTIRYSVLLSEKSACCDTPLVQEFFNTGHVIYCDTCCKVYEAPLDNDEFIPVKRIIEGGGERIYRYYPASDSLGHNWPSAKKEKRNFNIADLKYVISCLCRYDARYFFINELNLKWVEQMWFLRGCFDDTWEQRYRFHLSSELWFTIRNKVLERDAVCQYCFTNAAEQVHHLTYDRMGYEDLDDLKGICKFCHGQIPNMYEDWYPDEPTPQMLKNEEYKRALRGLVQGEDKKSEKGSE